MEKFGKKFEIYKTFSPPNRKYKAFIAFLCDNIFNFEEAKEANFFFLKQKSREFKRFLPHKPEIRLLLRFYVTTFSILKQKKQNFFF